MVQVAAWFVAGVAWPWVAIMTLALIGAVSGDADERYGDTGRPVSGRVTAVVAMVWALSSGVAVAATAVALGVGR